MWLTFAKLAASHMTWQAMLDGLEAVDFRITGAAAVCAGIWLVLEYSLRVGFERSGEQDRFTGSKFLF